MNTFAKHHTDLEHHHIDLVFSHTRIVIPLALKKLTASIDAHGQIVPVIVTPADTPHRFTLIDGYLRVQAMKKLRQDTIKAEVWECSEADALLSLLASHGQRNWEAFEEAQTLQELQRRYQMTQEQIAKRIGRTHSWISRRLSLLDISDEFIQAISEGAISVWSAYRVLVPVARATPLHAEYLLKYLRNNMQHSTRELSEFFQHYQKANKTTREKMVMQPDLFFKVQKAIKAQRDAKRLKSGPEGQWQYRLSNIKDQIKHLEKLVPQLFYERQEEKVCQQLLLPLEQIQDGLNRILITSRRPFHDRQDEASNHCYVTPSGQELSAH